MELLEIRNLTKYFGGLAAISELDIFVKQGEILGLIGPNGAGKTTLFNVVSGIFRPTSGRIIFKGEDIAGLKADKIARSGIHRTFQSPCLFQDFTVLDNMRVACHMASNIGFVEALFAMRSTRVKERHIDERAMEILRFTGMEALKDEPARNLSHGYQKTLSLSLALPGNPEILLLDEPLTALNPERLVAITGLISKVRAAGTAVLLIEHNMKAIFSICDRIVVLSSGRKIAEGLPHEVRENQAVIQAYLGSQSVS